MSCSRYSSWYRELEPGEPAEDEGAVIPRLGGELEVRRRARQLGHGDLQLEARERRADTEVDAATEAVCAAVLSRM